MQAAQVGRDAPADELLPRQVKVFEPERLRVRAVTCGATSTFFTTRQGNLIYFCGSESRKHAIIARAHAPSHEHRAHCARTRAHWSS